MLDAFLQLKSKAVGIPFKLLETTEVKPTVDDVYNAVMATISSEATGIVVGIRHFASIASAVLIKTDPLRVVT